MSTKNHKPYNGQNAYDKLEVLRKEFIVMLKAVTERKNDFDDIRAIIEKDKRFDRQYLIDEVSWQFNHMVNK